MLDKALMLKQIHKNFQQAFWQTKTGNVIFETK